MHAIILAGGQGTRLRPLTDVVPKPLVELCGAPYAAGLLRRLARGGVTRATFLVATDPAPYASLDDVAAEVGIQVSVTTESEPLGTAGAARQLLADAPDEPVIVCNGDVLTDLDHAALVAAHRAAGAVATIALTEVDDTSSFGVVVCDDDGLVQSFVEKPDPGTVDSRTVNAGTYVLTPAAFAPTPGDGPLSFERDVFPGLLHAGARILGVVSPGYWADLGTPRRYLDGQAAVLRGECDWPLGPGIAQVGNAAVHLGARLDEAVLGDDVTVSEGADVRGTALSDTAVHAGAVVGAGAQLRGCIVGPGAVVAPGTVLADTVVI